MRREPTVTLAGLLAANQTLYLHCEACSHRREMDLAALAVAHAVWLRFSSDMYAFPLGNGGVPR
jgi:hypothetical protein